MDKVQPATIAERLGVEVITICYNFPETMGMLTMIPHNISPNQRLIVGLFESIDPAVEEIRIIPGGTNYCGIIYKRIGNSNTWTTSVYDTREDLSDAG